MVPDSHPERRYEAEPTKPVVPKVPRNCCREHESQQHAHREVILMLPLYERVAAKIRVVNATSPELGLEDHPSNVAPEQPALGIVGVLIRVRVPVVRAMAASPPEA
jgi:hypothetical protein